MIRSLMIVLALTFAAGGALADSKDDVLRMMAKCAGTSGKKARLKCFDEASPALRALFPNGVDTSSVPLANALPPAALAAAPTPSVAAPSAAVATAEPTEEQQKSWFGLDFGGHKRLQSTPEQFGSENIPQRKVAGGPPERPKEIDEISASLSDYAKTPLGGVVLFLDNGQVWRQSESDGTKVFFKEKTSDNTVVISRGALGSYSMRINNRGSIVKVTRVK